MRDYMALSKHARCNQVLTFEWRNSLLYRPLCLQKLLLNMFNKQYFHNVALSN